MDSNLSLTIGLKGQIAIQAQAVPMQEGYLKLGGIVADTTPLAFGVVVSADPDTPDKFEAGVGAGNIVRGVCVFDDAVAQNALAHPASYLPGMPCAAINHGFFYLGSWKKDATDAIAPKIGCKVMYKDATGEIQFLDSSDSAPSNWTVLTNASVRSVDENGALIYLD